MLFGHYHGVHFIDEKIGRVIIHSTKTPIFHRFN